MQIPGPDTRVVELRVHGILGTTGEDLTDAVASVDVAGDGVGRIVRPADRHRRPVPGPTLTAGERTVPRVVEGYVWSAMTSGGLVKAAWALLFPFALANMAHWMLPPTNQDSYLSKALSGALRALLRLAALLLTMLFVAQLTVIGLDLLAAQCLAPGSKCLGFVPEAARMTDVLRTSAALLLVGLAVFIMSLLAGTSWQVSTAAKEREHHSARAPVLPGANVVADPDAPALRALHVAGALAIMVLLALGGPFAGTADPRWFAAAVLVGIAVFGVLALDDPSGSRLKPGNALLRFVLSPLSRRVLVAVGSALVASVAVVPPRLNQGLPGSGGTIDLLTASMLLTCAAVAVLLLPAAWLARSHWANLAPRLRPWAGGWMAAPVLLIACLLGTGFGAGLAIGLRQTIGRPDLRLPLAYNDVAVFWGITTVLAVMAALVGVPWMLLHRWRRLARPDSTVPAEIALLHAGRKQDQRSAATAWQLAELQRRYSHRALIVLAGVLGASTTLTLLARVIGVPFSEGWRWLISLGVTALALLAGGLLRMVYLAAKGPRTAKYIGVLCDLTLFWPREAHPVVPPCYALKVIPELVARASEHLSDPNTRVILVGHSQGSLLATVAAARLLDYLPEQDRERVGLVTAGSQLQWAYSRAFPGVVPHASLKELAGLFQGRWRSLCRGTDPIGGAVSTWNRQVYDGMLIGVGFRGDGTEGPLPAAVRGPTGALVLGGDHWLPDPQRGPFSFRRWLPGVLAHTEYSSDPEWDRAVAMAAGLEIPVRGATLPLRTPTTVGPQVEPAAHTAGGGERASYPVVKADQDAELSDPLAENDAEQASGTEHGSNGNGLKSNGHAVPTLPGQGARAEPSELPEIIEPRGRPAPWERGVALRRSER